MPLLDHDEFGLAGPEVGEADHLVADGHPGDLGPHLLDHPGQVAALARRERGGPAVVHEALADGGLAGVDPGGADADEDLAGAGNRAGHLAEVEHVDAAITIEADGLGHGGISSVGFGAANRALAGGIPDQPDRISGIPVVLPIGRLWSRSTTPNSHAWAVTNARSARPQAPWTDVTHRSPPVGSDSDVSVMRSCP